MSRHYKVTLADALDAHIEALREGGRPGIVSYGSIESAIARPYCGYFRPVHLKAAALLHALVKTTALWTQTSELRCLSRC